MRRILVMKYASLLIAVVLIAGCANIQKSETNNSPEIQQPDQDQRIFIQSANQNLIVVAASGTAPVDTSELRVILGDSAVPCKWSSEIIKPGELAACQLQDICTGWTVAVIAPGNFQYKQC